MAETTCTGDGCGRPIRWVLTVEGRRMPLDPEPHPDGNVIAVEVDGRVRARVLGGSELPALTQAWRPHWVTCPASPQFKRRSRAATPRCGKCRDPLHRLAVEAGWTIHPLCGGPADFRDQVEHAIAGGQ